MADSRDDTGKGASRPYATIDLKATELGAKPAAASAGGGRAQAGRQRQAVAAALAWFQRRRRLLPPLSSLGAGIAGGLVALLASLLFANLAGREPEPTRQLAALERRLAELERALGGQSVASGQRIDALTRTAGALESTSAKLSAELNALKDRVGTASADAPLIAERVAKLENAITAVSVAAGGDGNEVVRSGLDRFEREVAGAKAAAGRLAERLDRSEQELRSLAAGLEGLKGDIERGFRGSARADEVAQLRARAAAVDKDLEAFVKTEADRRANASRVVLSLELSNLKRAIERGEGFAAELTAAKKAAGDRLNLAVFDGYANTGAPPLAELGKSFRRVANAMLDAEEEPADATLMERLLAGAKSIVRIRKSGPGADDGSLEATIARMEAALKENRLGELIAQSKKLPAKAQLAGEDWLRQVELRYQVEQALADTEAALKRSLAAPAAATDRRQ
jgi:hypothetical protein